MLPAGLTSQHLRVVLQTHLRRCHQIQLSRRSRNHGSCDRDETVAWLLSMNTSPRFSSETVALSVMLLDRFIDVIKIQAKYLRCVAVSCLYVAVKINEEDEVIPSTQAFVRQTGCGYTVSEVLRMERIILSKLDWKLWSPTALDFIHILHALMMIHNPDLLDHLTDTTPSQHVAVVTRKLFACLERHDLVAHGNPTLAIALLSLELEQFTNRWFAVTLALQRLVEVDNADLIRCREHVTRYLLPFGPLHAPYSLSPSYPRKPFSVKRKVAHDTPVADDGVKRLYSDDTLLDDAVRSSCSCEVRSDTDEPIGTTVVAT